MSKYNFVGGQVQLFDDQGEVLAGGKVYFYEPGTTTAKDTYTTSSLGTANANPVILDSAGRATIWLNGDYKVILKDSSDVTIYTEDNINPTTAIVSGNFNLIENPSFENDTNSDSVPDSWDLVEYAGSTNAIDTTNQSHGQQSMKFTSTGSGGGYITTNSYFEVSNLAKLGWSFDLKCSVVDVRILAQVLWYDASKTAHSSTPSTDLYDESAANPTSWTNKTGVVTPPSGAYFAKFRFYGCHSSDATAGSAWVDNAQVSVLSYPVTNIPYDLRISSVDATSGSGPDFTIDRNSPSPAASDTLGRIIFMGRNDAATPEEIAYASIIAGISDPTDSSEDGVLHLRTIQGGSSTTALSLAQGAYSPNAVGGDKGDDTLNVQTMYENNIRVQTDESPRVLAWVTFDASSGDPTVIAKSDNVSSTITDNGVGNFTINFSPALPTANYAVSGSSSVTAGNRLIFPTAADNSGVFAMSTTACQVKLFEPVGQTYYDAPFASIVFVANS